MIAKLNSKFEVAHFINGEFVGDIPEWVYDLKHNLALSIDGDEITLCVGNGKIKVKSYVEVYLVRRFIDTKNGKRYVTYPHVVTPSQFSEEYEIIE